MQGQVVTHKQVLKAVINLDAKGIVQSIDCATKYDVLNQASVGKPLSAVHPLFKGVSLEILKKQQCLELQSDNAKTANLIVSLTRAETGFQILVIEPNSRVQVKTDICFDLRGMGCWTYDIITQRFTMNAVMKEYLGLSDQEKVNDITPLKNALSAMDFHGVMSKISELKNNATEIIPYLLVGRVDGSSAYIEFYIEKRGTSIIALCRDVTEEFMGQECFHQAFECSSIGMALVKPNGSWFKVNKALQEMLGYSKQQLLSTDFQSITHPDDLDKDVDLAKQVLDDKIKTYQMEKRYYKKNGDLIWVLLSVSLIRDVNNVPVYFISQIQDISSRKAYENDMQRVITVDGLTGLPNRNMLLKKLEHPEMIEKASLIIIDLDRFKRINELYGVDVGDKVIQKSADRIKKCAGKRDMAGRLGGDEFYILVNQKVEEDNKVLAILNKIISSFEEPFYIEDYEFFISISAGVSIYPDTTESISDLIPHAEVALDKIKSMGGGQYTTYTKSIRDEQHLKRQIEFFLKEAVENNQIEAYYQPQFDIKTIDCVGFEALARWHCPNLPNITPGKFIEIAEEGRFVHKIDLCIMEQALKTLQEHVMMGAFTTISVNLSALTLSYRGIVTLLDEVVKKYNFPHEQVILEVTETRLLEDIERAKKTLKALSALGFKIAVDDFGTGYSSLQYLRDFTVDIIKIDQSFTQKIEDEQTKMVVKAAIEMGQAIGAKVLAEGVETTSQLDTLVALGCDEIQGYLYGEPTKDPFKHIY